MGLNIDRGDGVNTEMGASFIKEDLFYPRFKSRRGWQMGTGRLHLEQIQELYFKVTLASIILAKAFEREQIQRLHSQPRFLHRFFFHGYLGFSGPNIRSLNYGLQFSHFSC